MPTAIRLPPQGTGIDHFKVYKAEILGYAGPRVGRRNLQDLLTGPTLIIDRGYPVPEQMNAHSWQFYNELAATVFVGDLIFLVLFATGVDDLEVRWALPMKQDMAGKGVWNHLIDAGIGPGGSAQVEKDDLVGIWIRGGADKSGAIPNPGYDRMSVSENIGAYRDTSGVGTTPVQGTVYTNVSTLNTGRRYSFALRGPGTGGSEALSYTQITNVNDEPFTQGDSFLVPTKQDIGVTGTDPAYYLHDAAGIDKTLSGEANLFDNSTANGMTVPNDGATYYLSIRLAQGVNLEAVQKLILNPQTTINSSTALMSVTVFWSDDAEDAGAHDNDPDDVPDWRQIFDLGEDWSLQASSGQTADQHAHINLARKVKWIQLRFTNNTSISQSVGSVLLFPLSTLLASGLFVPTFGDGLAEFFLATEEGVTMELTADVTTATDTLPVDNAEDSDFDGLAAGQSIWIRNGTERVRYEILVVNGPPTNTIQLTTNLIENHSAGELIDSRFLVLRVDVFDTGIRKISESPPLIVPGTFREKWFSRTKELV